MKMKPEGNRFGTVRCKTFGTDGFNQVLGYTNLKLATSGSHMNKQVKVVLWHYSNTPINSQMVYAKGHKHKKATDFVKERGRYPNTTRQDHLE